MADLVVEPDHRTISRTGRTKRQRVAINQSLYAGRRRGGIFHALIRDPETGATITDVMLCVVKPGEAFDCVIEFELTEMLDRSEVEDE